ncbi:hypothetical protein [Aeromicrobium alkaliterrae]|uniref:Uncharacterized protein n=1 Tax=Aeromicrobium alkaliterrae TaxID=302168 RepID=A0ABN2KAI7_9ACTN
MGIQVTARGTLLAKPESIVADRGDVAAVMFGTRQEVHHEGQVVVFETVPTAELVCTGALAAELLHLKKSDVVDVRATMTVNCKLSDVTDRFARGSVTFHAETVDLAEGRMTA